MVGGDYFAEVVLAGDFVDVLDGDFFGEGEGNFVTANEVDAVDVFVVHGNADGAGEDDDPGGDEGGFAVFEEVEVGFFEEGECEDLGH